ncbi:MAG: pyrroline-5-carboxylate reductase [Lachnospiraceae bacterium]|nr:pyrroline-5-carboxylate reductase [Lachnospiraceae bacterium]
MKIGFIGLGNMASAMIGGIIKNGVLDPKEILGSTKTKASLRKAEEEFGICTMEDNVSVAEQADMLILSIKPQMYEEVIGQIKGSIKKDAVIVSIAPGKTLDWLADCFGFKKGEGKLVRCMPNTPALVMEGCTGVCFSKAITEEEKEQVLKILQSFGKALVVPEHLMDTVVGVSGSAPAYVFLFIEALADGAVAEGMPRKQAYEFAAQAVYGSAKMVLETGKHPAELKDMVCSPGGTTIEAVSVLEKTGFNSSIIEAERACIHKSRQL